MGVVQCILQSSIAMEAFVNYISDWPTSIQFANEHTIAVCIEVPHMGTKKGNEIGLIMPFPKNEVLIQFRHNRFPFPVAKRELGRVKCASGTALVLSQASCL